MWKNWEWNLWVVRQEPAGTWWSSYIFNNVATRCVDIVFFIQNKTFFYPNQRKHENNESKNLDWDFIRQADSWDL